MTATAIASTPGRLTYEQYVEELCAQPPTRQPYDIIDGVLNMSPAPDVTHQRTVTRLVFLLVGLESISAARVFTSPLDVVIRREPLRTRQPDVLVISEQRCTADGGIDMHGPLTVAPELVIEVLSPSETRRTVYAKIADHQEVGVVECWIVSPQAETIELLSLSPDSVRTAAVYGQGDEVQSLMFPAIKLPNAGVFA